MCTKTGVLPRRDEWAGVMAIYFYLPVRDLIGRQWGVGLFSLNGVLKCGSFHPFKFHYDEIHN